MVTRHSERVGRYLSEYSKYFRSYFSSSFQGNEAARQYSARKVMELNRIAREQLSDDHHRSYTAQRDAFRRDFFQKFRDWIMVACMQDFDALAVDQQLRQNG